MERVIFTFFLLRIKWRGENYSGGTNMPVTGSNNNLILMFFKNTCNMDSTGNSA